jgi:hypothetical protein
MVFDIWAFREIATPDAAEECTGVPILPAKLPLSRVVEGR